MRCAPRGIDQQRRQARPGGVVRLDRWPARASALPSKTREEQLSAGYRSGPKAHHDPGSSGWGSLLGADLSFDHRLGEVTQWGDKTDKQPQRNTLQRVSDQAARRRSGMKRVRRQRHRPNSLPRFSLGYAAATRGDGQMRGREISGHIGRPDTQSGRVIANTRHRSPLADSQRSG